MIEMLADHANIERPPTIEGKMMSMVLVPKTS
jgi:translation initiation factor IF-3